MQVAQQQQPRGAQKISHNKHIKHARARLTASKHVSMAPISLVHTLVCSSPRSAPRLDIFVITLRSTLGSAPKRTWSLNLYSCLPIVASVDGV